MIKKIVPRDLCSDCFVAYYGRMRGKQGKSVAHVERLFPGYVFIVSDTPESLFFHLKNVPAMSKMIFDRNFTFLTLEKHEKLFLRDMLGENRIVHLSYVKVNRRGIVNTASLPLSKYMTQIQHFQLEERYVIPKLQLGSVGKAVVLGIILNENIQQEIEYGKVRTPVRMPDRYTASRLDEKEALAVGGHVKVTSGSLESMTDTIWKVKKNTVEVGVGLFGQDMAIEIPRENIYKNFL